MKSDITMLIHNKDDIEFFTEFPCLLGHPAYTLLTGKPKNANDIRIFRFGLYVKIGIFHAYDIRIFVTLSLVKLRISYS